MEQNDLIAYLTDQMKRNYTVSQLMHVSPDLFRRRLESLEGVVDYEAEHYHEYEKEQQRDLSIKFHWGHDHDFGSFEMKGRMRDRHIRLMADFCRHFAIDPAYFHSKRVFDIGSWTGGTALLLGALGAQVDTIEEVSKYAETTRYLVDSFGKTEQITVENLSLYACDDPSWYDRYEIAYFPGVLYHLSDPVLALRIIYNALKMDGVLLLETAGFESEAAICRYEGSQIYHAGTKEDLNRGGWNWFIPSTTALQRMLYAAGFDKIRTVCSENGTRLYAYAEKTRLIGITKAGLSKPSIR